MPKFISVRFLLPLVLWLGLNAFDSVDSYEFSAGFALLIAYPMALNIDRDTPMWLKFTCFLTGVFAAVSLTMETGFFAGLLASSWFIFVVPNLAHGLIRFMNSERRYTADEAAALLSVFGPVIAGVALVSSRGFGHFAGFPEPLAILTVTHFLFTFGLLPVAIAAFTKKFREQSPLDRSEALVEFLVGIIIVTPILIGVWFASRTEKMVPSITEASLTLLLAIALTGWCLFAFVKLAKGLPVRDAVALRLAAVGISIGAILGAIFALRLAAGLPPITLDAMVHSHGIILGISVTTLGIVAARQSPLGGKKPAAHPPHADAPLRDVDPGSAMFKDHRVFDLGPDKNGRFEAISDALLRYSFYPESVMTSVAPFKRMGRHARVGDRIGMVLIAPVFPGLAPLRFPATTQVNLARITDEFAEFGYVTTTQHYGRGAWSARILRVDGSLKLLLSSRMTPTATIALAGLPFYRRLQKRAHRLGAEHLAKSA